MTRAARGTAPSSVAAQVTALALDAENGAAEGAAPPVLHVELAGSHVLIRREQNVVVAIFKAAAA